MIRIIDEGNFDKTKKFLMVLSEVKGLAARAKIESLARAGVEALANATPVDTGKTASSWEYEIVEEDGKLTVYWNNTNVIRGINIAIILQYGHATRNGGYVEGRDYINPALRSVFDKMASSMWEAVVSL